MRIRIALILCLLGLTGCNQAAIIQRFTPPADDQMARSFIDDLRLGRLFEAEALVDQRESASKVEPSLEKMEKLLHGGSPIRLTEIGFNTNFVMGNGHRTQTTVLTYEINLSTGWFVSTIVIVKDGAVHAIRSAHFNGIPRSLEAQNRFTFAGKSVFADLFLLLVAVIPIFSLSVLILCIRTPLKRKWLWVLFILLGLGTVTLNWSTGKIAYHTLFVQLLGASAVKWGVYSPWLFSVSIPLGAILFLVKRSRLTAQASQPLSTTPPPLA